MLPVIGIIVVGILAVIAVVVLRKQALNDLTKAKAKFDQDAAQVKSQFSDFEKRTIAVINVGKANKDEAEQKIRDALAKAKAAKDEVAKVAGEVKAAVQK